MEIKTLKNGLRILFYPMLNTHSVTIGLYIRAGAGYEQENYIGATHFLEHLHFRKCGNYSQEELYYRMECIGSTLRATTYRDFLQFTMKVRPNKIKECVEIFQNIILSDTWTNEEFEKEKKVVINQILAKGNYITLENEMRKVVFKNHTLKSEIMGDIDTIESLNRFDLQAYKKKLFSANNMLLCITGNIEKIDCKDIIEKLQILSINQEGEERRIYCPSMFQHRKPDILFRYVQDDNPLEVNMSFDIIYQNDSKDYLTILNCILGEGVGSKLQKIIREEQCYSSDISSYVEWYQKFAVLHIRFTVDKKSLIGCLEDVLMILSEMKCKISKKDLEVSLPFYSTNYEFYEDDTEEMNFQLAYNKFILGMEYQSMELENNNETINFLHKLAQHIFVKENMSLIVIGDTKRITKKSIKQIMNKL